MARSTAQIQADIAVTRRLAEEQLDALRRRLTARRWWPYALVGAGLVGGVMLAQLPLVRLLRIGSRAARTGITVIGTLATINRLVAERRAAGLARPRSEASLRRAS
jgi:hypothetical protein